jgi:hypothetical protein
MADPSYCRRRFGSIPNTSSARRDTIGVGVEALQELRFAAKASGVEQQTLDMALQRFTRRTAEAAPPATPPSSSTGVVTFVMG